MTDGRMGYGLASRIGDRTCWIAHRL